MTKKRKLFDELMLGVKAMQHQRECKRTHEVDELPPLQTDAELISESRK